MKITVNKSPIVNTLKNIFIVKISTYAGDMDHFGSDEQKVTKDQIVQRLVEIEMVRRQFNGRGGCRRMYDQTNYFVFPMGDDDYEDSEDLGDAPSDGYFDWLDSESGFPYEYDYEQNHTIEGYEVTWYDDNGVSYAVSIQLDRALGDDVLAMNKAHKIGDYKVWEDNTPGLDEAFAAYRADAIELVKKHVALATLEM